MAGRPRGVDDAVILRAAVEVIGRVGPAKLTLAAVADEVGLVPGTLVQRFGSKRGLLLALAQRSVQDAETLYERAREGHGSAPAALRGFATRSMAEMATPEKFANHLAFLCMDLTDPEFHEPALAVHETQGRVIAMLLADAMSDGDLRPGTDVEALAGSVQVAISGAGLTWALDRRGTLTDRIEHEIGTVLAPHAMREEAWRG
ncbi:TetR/AcrR family transcriptional regulator [Actinomadura darangshiensis]|uniref:TetR/AcrR family transcriptional regulator n=1 Tax=Actinomadura darangshiensis TaxID=705336 RepID=A0A4V2YVP0_9ACTN|nr:TetR/AcrR family transcriptional regulator [Actinomadura darangshiensis]TDD82347.1 TetR/AcrR family transcriptional regulator [Actinomadura darangshiensis]